MTDPPADPSDPASPGGDDPVILPPEDDAPEEESSTVAPPAGTPKASTAPLPSGKASPPLSATRDGSPASAPLPRANSSNAAPWDEADAPLADDVTGSSQEAGGSAPVASGGVAAALVPTDRTKRNWFSREKPQGRVSVAPKTRPKRAVARVSVREMYRTACYRLLGRRYDLAAEGRTDPDPLAEKLSQANVRSSPGMFRAVRLITTLVAICAMAVFTWVFFAYVIQPAYWYLYVGALVGVAGLAVYSAFSFTVRAQISNRSTRLERELPFTLSELSIYASTGMSPIDLVHQMARRNRDPAMTSAFKDVVYKTDIQGKDLITSLSETAKESPSEALRETFWGLANMIHQGGNLDEYLRQKAEDVLKIKRSGQKAFIERLTTYVDMYISLILIGVLMIAVGAFLINAFGTTVGGIDSNGLLLLLTFGLVPVSVAITVILVMTAYARSE